jgi:hypothetical protein
MHIDPPIHTAGLDDSDIPALIERVREAMEKHFSE